MNGEVGFNGLVALVLLQFSNSLYTHFTLHIAGSLYNSSIAISSFKAAENISLQDGCIYTCGDDDDVQDTSLSFTYLCSAAAWMEA